MLLNSDTVAPIPRLMQMDGAPVIGCGAIKKRAKPVHQKAPGAAESALPNPINLGEQLLSETDKVMHGRGRRRVSPGAGRETVFFIVTDQRQSVECP